jgi:hypothetical protein
VSSFREFIIEAEEKDIRINKSNNWQIYLQAIGIWIDKRVGKQGFLDYYNLDFR